jgi:hypothetical protein
LGGELIATSLHLLKKIAMPPGTASVTPTKAAHAMDYPAPTLTPNSQSIIERRSSKAMNLDELIWGRILQKRARPQIGERKQHL